MLLHLLEKANQSAQIKNLQYCKIDEFNSFLQSFTINEFPVNVVVPVNENGVNLGNQVKGTYNIEGWILVMVPEDANLISTRAVEEFLSPLRKQARSFITALCNSNMVDPEVKGVPYNIQPEYRFLSMLLFGVSYSVKLPVKFSPC